MSSTHRSSRRHRDEKDEKEEPRRSTRNRVPTEKVKKEEEAKASASRHHSSSNQVQASAPKVDKGKKAASPSPEAMAIDSLSISSSTSFEATVSIEDSIGVDDWELDITQFSATAIKMEDDKDPDTGAPLLHWQVHAVGKEAVEVEVVGKGKDKSKRKKIEYKTVSIIFDSRREMGPKGEWLASISYVFLLRYKDFRLMNLIF